MPTVVTFPISVNYTQIHLIMKFQTDLHNLHHMTWSQCHLMKNSGFQFIWAIVLNWCYRVHIEIVTWQKTTKKEYIINKSSDVLHVLFWSQGCSAPAKTLRCKTAWSSFAKTIKIFHQPWISRFFSFPQMGWSRNASTPSQSLKICCRYMNEEVTISHCLVLLWVVVVVSAGCCFSSWHFSAHRTVFHHSIYAYDWKYGLQFW